MTADICNAETVCEWDPLTGACQTKIGCVRHMWDSNSEASCENDPSCMWSFAEQMCNNKTGCALFQSDADCMSATGLVCDWVSTTTPNGAVDKCVERGCLSHQDMNDCAGDPECSWFAFTDIPRCDAKCTPYTEAKCDSIKICSWDATAATCEAQTGCTWKDTNTTCNELAACAWTYGTNGVASCAEIACGNNDNQDDCLTKSDKCVWTEDNICTQDKQCPYFASDTVCLANTSDSCAWTDDNKCISVTDCEALGTATDCHLESACEWKGSCRLICNEETCKNGTCSQDGTCECAEGFSGTDCSICALTDVNGECTAQCTEALCSNHGYCDEFGACVCKAGWTGPYCDVMACPARSNFVTTYPLRPLKDELFTIIIHGCFATKAPHQVKVVHEGGDCNEVVSDSCVYKSGDTKLFNDANNGCTAITHEEAVVEPLAQMELLVNSTVSIADADSANFTVCWRGVNATSWEQVSSHTNEGDFHQYIMVQSEADANTGSAPSAAPGAEGLEEYCCEGLRIGELCLPAALIIIVWVLLMLCICGLVYAIVRSKTQTQEVNKKETERKYDGFEMEDGTHKMLEEDGDEDESSVRLSERKSSSSGKENF